MIVGNSPVRDANSGISAYERQCSLEQAASFAAPRESRQRTFSLGPFTVRYEEEESFDFSTLAKAASSQLERVRRFNFAEALQSEAARSEFSAGDEASAVSTMGAPQLASGAYESIARAAESLAGLSYGADGRIRSPQLYFSAAAAESMDAVKSTADIGLENKDYAVTAVTANAARTRTALTAYLAADRAASSSTYSGRLVSGAV